VLLHRLVLVPGQAPRLEQDPVGDRHLADVVQRRRAAQERRLLGGQPEPAGEQLRDAPDPLRVPVGVVVAVLRREREALEDLQPRLLQVPRALAHPVLEAAGVLGELALQPPGLQQVRHPQADLVQVERLGEEVRGAGRQRTAADLHRDVGRSGRGRAAGPRAGGSRARP
jgi:hypothetical protein